jgi:hypothetical protein
MSPRPRFFSRRAVLSIMSAVPASLAAGGAHAHQPEECEDLVGKHGLKFAKVGSLLWDSFLKGVKRAEQAHKEVAVDRDVFQEALELSGPYVVQSLHQFNQYEEHVDVFRCCIACGYAAAGYAYEEEAKGKPRLITRAIFRKAWCDTKECYNETSCKGEYLDPPHGPKRPPQTSQTCAPPTEDDLKKIKIRSVGCG